MDKKMQRRLVIATGAVVAFVTAILFAFIVPEATRVTMVANMGVQTADMIKWVFYAIAAMAIVAGAYLAVNLTRQIHADMRTASIKRHQEENPYQPPSLKETDPNVIKSHLRQAAERRPEVKELINTSIAQLEALQKALGSISTLFKVNPGIVTDAGEEYELSKFELLLERVIEDTCTDMVGIVYMAMVAESTTTTKLAGAIERTNSKHAMRVDAANSLALAAAETLPEVDSEYRPSSQSMQQLLQLLGDLSDTASRRESS